MPRCRVVGDGLPKRRRTKTTENRFVGPRPRGRTTPYGHGRSHGVDTHFRATTPVIKCVGADPFPTRNSRPPKTVEDNAAAATEDFNVHDKRRTYARHNFIIPCTRVSGTLNAAVSRHTRRIRPSRIALKRNERAHVAIPATSIAHDK